MQRPGFVMDHPAGHWNRVPQRFISNPDLFERVNPACRNRQIDRAPADDVSFSRISAPLEQIHLVATPPQIRGEQSASQTAADQNKPCHSVRIYESGNQESRKSRQAESPTRFTASDRDALQFFEGVTEVIENIARQQRLLALVAMKNCDLRCPPA